MRKTGEVLKESRGVGGKVLDVGRVKRVFGR